MHRFFKTICIVYLAFVVAITFSPTYILFLACFVILLMLALLIERRNKENSLSTAIRNDSIADGNNYKSKTKEKLFPVAYGLTVFCLSSVYWLAFYPGGFNLDAYGQWLQAHHLMPYQDWHPFISTILLELVVKLKDSFEFYIVLQILAFSIATAYMLFCFQKAGINQHLLLIAALFIGINPAVGLNTVCLTKDAQFTIVCILLTGLTIRIITTNGSWFVSTIHLVTLSILCSLAVLVRHNGFLFVVPMILLFIMSYPALYKKILGSILCMLILVLAVKGPIQLMMNVEKHENVLGEITGIPMGMMANALVEDADHLPEETHLFLNEIADDTMWRKKYVLGEWDSCRWFFGGEDLLKEYNLVDIIRYTTESIINCPQACYSSFRENTRMVWSIYNAKEYWIPNVYVENNDFGIKSSPNEFFKSIVEGQIELTMKPVVSSFFWNIGLLLVLAILSWLGVKKAAKMNLLLLFFPYFTYMIGTMFLLSGPNQRYFYSGEVILPVGILFMCSIFDYPILMKRELCQKNQI